MPFIESLNLYIEKIRNHPLVERDFSSVFEEFKNSESVLDLGCGNGHFLQEYLFKYPQKLGLGIERRFKRVFKTAEKLKALPNKNLSGVSRVIQGNIFEFL